MQMLCWEANYELVAIHTLWSSLRPLLFLCRTFILSFAGVLLTAGFSLMGINRKEIILVQSFGFQRSAQVSALNFKV